MTAAAKWRTVGRTDHTTRHQLIAQRFLASLAQQHGREAPAVLRAMADELERILTEPPDLSRTLRGHAPGG